MRPITIHAADGTALIDHTSSLSTGQNGVTVSQPNELTRLQREAAQQLVAWQRRATLHLVAYNRAANRCQSWDARLGGLAALISAVVGTAVFATLELNVGVAARIIVGVVSVGAAVLAAIQVFAGLPRRIEDYQKAGRRFGSIRREIETARVLLVTQDSAEVKSVLDRTRARLDEAAEIAPNAPHRIWNQTERQLRGEFTRWERTRAWLRGLEEPSVAGLSDMQELSALEDPRSDSSSSRASSRAVSRLPPDEKVS